MRAGRRVTENLHQVGFYFIGNDVLPTPGFQVSLLPGEPDDVSEQALGQPVLAHHAFGDIAALLGQRERPASDLDVTLIAIRN